MASTKDFGIELVWEGVCAFLLQKNVYSHPKPIIDGSNLHALVFSSEADTKFWMLRKL